MRGEPWRVEVGGNVGRVYDKDGKLIIAATVLGENGTTDEEAVQHLVRAVLCVNALAGIPSCNINGEAVAHLVSVGRVSVDALTKMGKHLHAKGLEEACDRLAPCQNIGTS